MVEPRVEKPWGWYQVLWRGPDACLKRLIIRKGEAISVQYHNRRKEVWTIISGSGFLKLDGTEQLIVSGDAITIHQKQQHSAEAVGRDLVIYELQVGECDENDIVRLSDKYGRI